MPRLKPPAPVMPDGGFAVVADEVKKLAQQTSVATTDISQTLVALQDMLQGMFHQLREADKQVMARAA